MVNRREIILKEILEKLKLFPPLGRGEKIRVRVLCSSEKMFPKQ
jgi:hypothetical protein